MKSPITIKIIQDLLLQGLPTTCVDDETSRRMWWASLEVIQKEFLSQHYHQGGIWFASPLPALTEKKYLSKLKGWLWSPGGYPYFYHENAGYLPAEDSRKNKDDSNFIGNYKKNGSGTGFIINHNGKKIVTNWILEVLDAFELREEF